MSDFEENILDFDALKAARAEKLGDAPSPKARIGGEVYELPRVLPASFLFGLGALQKNDFSHLEDMINDVFGDHAETVKPKMDTDDIQVFMNEMPEKLYGTQSGESSDSSPS